MIEHVRWSACVAAALALAGCSEQPPARGLDVALGVRAVQVPPGAIAVFGVEVHRPPGLAAPVSLSLELPEGAPLVAHVDPSGAHGTPVVTVRVARDATPGAWTGVLHASGAGSSAEAPLRILVLPRDVIGSGERPAAPQGAGEASPAIARDASRRLE